MMSVVAQGAVRGVVRAMGTSLLIVLFFILQYIFNLEFQCPCRPDWRLYDLLYFTAPPVILTWVLVHIESHKAPALCERMVCCSVTSCSSGCLTAWSCVGRIFLRFVSVFVVWVTALLFEGHWYLCHVTSFNATHIGLPCKDQNKLTEEERVVQNGLKIESLKWGMIGLCASFCAWSVFTFLCKRSCSCCNGRQRSKEDVCCPPYYSVVYEDLLAEQVGKHLKEELTKLASERAQVLCQPHLQNIRKQIIEEATDDSETWHEISSSHFYMKTPVNQD